MLHPRLLIVLSLLAAGSVATATAAQAPSVRNTGTLASAWKQRARTFDSRHYRIKSDLPDDEARRIGAHLDLVFDACAGAFEHLRVSRTLRFEAMFFADPLEYQGVLKSDFDAEAQGTGGAALRRGGGTILCVHGTSLESMKRTIQHEALHQFVSVFLPDTPVWLNEGMAELFELGIVHENRLILGEAPTRRLEFLRAMLAQGRLAPMSHFLDVDSRDWLDDIHRGSASVNYEQAWLVVHFLMFGDGGQHRDELNRLLRELNQGQGWQGALQRSLGITPATAGKMERAIVRHLERLPGTEYQVLMRRLDFLAAGLAALHARGVRPEDLKTLRKELERIQFTHAGAFGDRAVLEADAPRLFQAPFDMQTGDTPAFVLVDPPSTALRAARRVVRRLEAEQAREAKRARRSRRTADDPPPPPRRWAANPLPPFIRVVPEWPVRYGVSWSLDAQGDPVAELVAKW